MFSLLDSNVFSLAAKTRKAGKQKDSGNSCSDHNVSKALGSKYFHLFSATTS